MSTPANPLTLAHWRRTMAEIYLTIRQTPAGAQAVAWQDWRARRNELFKCHPQSALDESQRATFRGLAYFNYDPAWRVTGRIDWNVDREEFEVDLANDGLLTYTRVAWTHFTVKGQAARLSLYWIDGYGGGIFIPFKDATNRQETYGAGRYLYDTIKGVDLGVDEGQIILDFNYAYNPSCAYNPRWVCPLSPHENTLPFPVTAGEKDFIHR